MADEGSLHLLCGFFVLLGFLCFCFQHCLYYSVFVENVPGKLPLKTINPQGVSTEDHCEYFSKSVADAPGNTVITVPGICYYCRKIGGGVG